MSPRKKEILFKNSAFRLTATSLKQGDLLAELTAPDCLQITTPAGSRTVGIPQALPPGVAGYRGQFPLLTAMYNLAAHELHANISPEGLLVAGAAWGGVWTRDIAYAAALGADIAAPEATRASLASRVRDGIILQDTGTGGSWPISTDRVVWALGAWAYYLSSGDEEWLNFSITALQNTLAQDAAVLRCTPLIPGETSFLDWREQSYPRSMSPADIGASYAFGTNVLHYMARRILARMLSAAGHRSEAEEYTHQAAELAQAIEKTFWHPATQRYNMVCRPNGCAEMRSDSLGTALAVLSGLASDHAEQALNALPRTAYGTPVFAPYQANTPEVYHNRSIWPFVEAFVLLAHAELQDTAGMELSMVALLRAAMAFGTNKENLHATTGEADQTVQNSDRQLWSTAGMLGIFYHGILGIQYEHDTLVFNPCIPESFGGSHWFTGLRIRNMVLDVHVNGYGSEICSVLINGKAASPLIPLDTTGHLLVELELMPPEGLTAAPAHPTAREELPAPRWAECDAKHLSWHRVPGAVKYRVYVNGVAQPATNKLSYAIAPAPRTLYREFRVRAFGQRSVASSLSEPYELIAPGARCTLQPLSIGEHGEYPVEHAQAWLDTRPCTSLLLYEAATLPRGTYSLRVLYCNATASLRDGDTCALRELRVDGAPIGIIPLPHHTEQGQWETYTLTAPIKFKLEQGTHTFSLVYTPACENMNRHMNQCMVRAIELTRLS